MALPSSGALSFSRVAAEFDSSYPAGSPYSLSDFYAGGRYVPAGAVNGAGKAIPSSGRLSLSDFYGAERRVAPPVPVPSARSRTFYRLASTPPSAPSATGYGAWDSPGTGWRTTPRDATITANVYQVTLTQRFSSLTQDSSTFVLSTWSAVTLHEERTGSDRTRVFYARGFLSLGVAAPTGETYDSWAHPGGPWTVDDPGPTTSLAVFYVVLNQSFRSRTVQNRSTFDSNVWSASLLHASPLPRTDSTRSRTFYRRATSPPAAPTGVTYAAYTSPGGGWVTTNPGVTTNESVYQVVLTQTFNSASQNAATFESNAWGSVTLNAAAVRTRRDSIYRQAATMPARPTGGTTVSAHVPSGWGTVQPTNPTQCVWLSRRTVTERRDYDGDWQFVSATRWGVAGKLVDIPAVYPRPFVNIDAGGGEIFVTVNPPASGWRGDCGASVSGKFLRGYTTGLVNDLGSAQSPAQVPFAGGFVGTFPRHEYYPGGLVTVTVWAVYSDGGTSVVSTASITAPTGEGGGRS